MRIVESRDICTIDLEGTIALNVSSELQANALACLSSGKPLVVSCVNADRLDSSALQILIALANELRKKGSALRLTGVSDSLAAYIKCAGLLDMLQAAEM